MDRFYLYNKAVHTVTALPLTLQQEQNHRGPLCVLWGDLGRGTRLLHPTPTSGLRNANLALGAA